MPTRGLTFTWDRLQLIFIINATSIRGKVLFLNHLFCQSTSIQSLLTLHFYFLFLVSAFQIIPLLLLQDLLNSSILKQYFAQFALKFLVDFAFVPDLKTIVNLLFLKANLIFHKPFVIPFLPFLSLFPTTLEGLMC